jgi:hypothetical protein
MRARSNRMRGWRARADRRVHDVHPAGGSPTAGPIARRLSGRAGALRSHGARGLSLTGHAALGDAHERAGDAERAHAGKGWSPHARFSTVAIGDAHCRSHRIPTLSNASERLGLGLAGPPRPC